MTSDRNERIYERRWSASARVIRLRPHLWKTLAPALDGKPLLEIGPGLRPTIPVEGSSFVDISAHAVGVLVARVLMPSGTRRVRFRSADRSFEGVFAFEVLEHVREDGALVAEIRRVVREGGLFVLSVPLRMDRWTSLDDLSAHVRRYEPEELSALLEAHGFLPEALEVRCETLGPISVAVKAALGERFPRLSDAALQHVLFPLLVAYQRRFATVRWVSSDAPIPGAATGVTVVARATASGGNRGGGIERRWGTGGLRHDAGSREPGDGPKSTKGGCTPGNS